MQSRATYITVARQMRTLAARLGFLGFLERRSGFWSRHLRTMFSIHDVEDLVYLDLPWWTYGAIDRVDSFLASKEARVFEFGSGASTVWLARRAAEVHSVEHEPVWAEIVKQLAGNLENVNLMCVPGVVTDGATSAASGRAGYEGFDFTDYVAAIDRPEGKFDLIVIDGRARLACLRAAYSHLADGGLILYDDIGRRRYRPARTTHRLSREVLRGARPGLPYRSSTGLLWPSASPVVE